MEESEPFFVFSANTFNCYFMILLINIELAAIWTKL